MQYDWPVVLDGGGRPHITEQLRSHVRRLQHQSGRTAPFGGAMPAWALELRPGSPAELLRPWPAPSHIGRSVTRAADALGVPIATWPLFGAHPLILILNWPTDDIDAVRAEKLAEVLVWETGPDSAPGARPSLSHSLAGDVAPLAAAPPPGRPGATVVSVGSAVPRPSSYAPPAATAAYSHVAVSNPLRRARPTATPLPVSSGSRVGFG